MTGPATIASYTVAHEPRRERRLGPRRSPTSPTAAGPTAASRTPTCSTALEAEEWVGAHRRPRRARTAASTWCGRDPGPRRRRGLGHRRRGGRRSTGPGATTWWCGTGPARSTSPATCATTTPWPTATASTIAAHGLPTWVTITAGVGHAGTILGARRAAWDDVLAVNVGGVVSVLRHLGRRDGHGRARRAPSWSRRASAAPSSTGGWAPTARRRRPPTWSCGWRPPSSASTASA